jgi:transcriptional regulator with XRE-family HTH domain
MTISSDERAFFVAMGERIASLRKARNLTQTQLAEALGVTQQTVQAYEAGSRRIPRCRRCRWWRARCWCR